MDGKARFPRASGGRCDEVIALTSSLGLCDDPDMPSGQALLNTALDYARRGWPVLPIHTMRDEHCSCGNGECKSPGKHPLNAHGVSEATTDEVTIRKWWRTWPDANIGIATGARSGLVVLDVDPDKGGDHSLYELASEHGNGHLPDTVEVMTGGGGRHIFFAHPGNGVSIRNIAQLAGLPALDVRGDGGYIVAPESLHASGHWYLWEVSSHPDDVPLAPLPEWLLELVRKPERQDARLLALPRPGGDGPHTYAQAALENELATLANTPEGARNDRLNRSAYALGQLVGVSLLDRNQVERELTKTALRIGLGERETQATIRSGIDAGTKEPRMVEDAWEPTKAQRLGNRLPRETAELIESVTLPCPDAELRESITNALLQTGVKAAVRRKSAGALLLTWLQGHGSFIRSRNDGRLCYFHAPDKHLFNLETNLWRAWLYALTGANPAGTDFAYLYADCKTAAQFAEEKEVVRVATWDSATQTLRVSRFDGVLYVLNGATIVEEDNGAHILFDDAPWWQPYHPELERTSGTALQWATSHMPSWDGKAQLHALGYRAWVLSSFFTELCPTRPLLVLLGEKGSGKTMTLRIFLQLLFGPAAQVSGVPDRPDGFTAAASASHILVIDNLDQFVGWLRDKLSRLSTGAIDQYRKLYTSNEVGTVRYRTWIASTARTPDTLRRDDLADRLLLLPTKHIPESERQPERRFLERTQALRNAWWGDVLVALNGVVARIRRGELADTSTLRMGDWESLGRLVARNQGQEQLWDKFVRNLKLRQSGFLLADDLIVEALDKWMKNSTNHGREVKVRELYSELTATLFGSQRPPRDWPQSTSSFGKRLVSIRRELRTLYEVEWWQEHNCWVYRFSPLDSQGS